MISDGQIGKAFGAILLLLLLAPIIGAQTPEIASANPSAAVVGTLITISGSSFGSTQGASTVTFNGANATISSWSASAITATLPASATTGNLVVTVAGTASNGVPFTVLSPSTLFQRAITIDHTKIPNTDQANLPVVVSGVLSFLATLGSGGRVTNANGYDIRFTSDSQGQQPLAHEIDSYDPATGTATFWVSIPTLSHTADTTIYMWYGDAGITASVENKAGVWSNGYAGVWHFGSGSTLGTADSTGYASNATNHGVSLATGIFGNAGSFDGTGNTYLRIPSSSSFKPTGAMTMEAWVKMSGATSNPDIFSLDYRADGSWSSPYQAYALDFYGSTLEPRVDFAVNGSQVATSGSSNISTGQWAHIVGSYDGSTLRVYSNGVQVSSLASSGSIAYSTSKDLDIESRSPYTSAEAVNGLIDEARISTVARSADWVTAEYRNQSSPSTFYSIGNEQVVPSVLPSIMSLSPNQWPSGVAGSIVISGLWFGSTQGTSTVTFNGVAATVTNWNDSSITAVIPTGTTTGNVVVTVNGVASNGVPFTVYQPYGNNYEYRRAIQIDHTKVANSDQTNFPLLISGTFPNLKTVSNSGQVQNSAGYDIVFASDPEGVNQLDHEIDNYNPATGTAGFWVRIPLLSHSTDTLIYMFYGNPAVTTSQENKAGVWGHSGYSAVYHFPAANLGADSTGTNNGMVGQVTAATGEIGGAASFPGYTNQNSEINVGNNASLNATNTLMISAWVYANSLNTFATVFAKGTTQGNGDYMMEDYGASWHAQVNNGIWSTGSSTASLTTGTWTRLDMCWDGTRMLQYMNGALNTTTVFGAQTLTPNSQNAFIGYNFINNEGWSGLIDELRVSTTGCHSSDWIATEYNNQYSPGTFYSVEPPYIAANPPSIDSLDPNLGPVGESVTLQGGGFGSSQGSSTVTFNGVAATATNWSDGAITATVPTGAMAGNVVVKVNGSASNGVPFTVYQAYGNNYEYRRAILIDHTKVANNDQTNFPMLISGTFPNLKTAANGG